MSGLTFNTKTTLNDAKIKADLTGKLKSCQAPLDAMILSDSNYFIPKKTGTMEKLSILNTRIGSGTLVWPADYSRAQYYGVTFDHSKQLNPNACSKWFEAAKARWLNKWVRFVYERIKRS